MNLPRVVVFYSARMLCDLYATPKEDLGMADIIEQIASTIAEWEHQDIACGPPCDMLREAAQEIRFLRATIADLRQVAGAVSVENFDWKALQDLRKGLIPRYPEGPISYEIDPELAKELK